MDARLNLYQNTGRTQGRQVHHLRRPRHHRREPFGEDVEADIDAGLLGELGEPAAVVEQELVAADLDVDGRQAGGVGVQRVGVGVLRVGAPRKPAASCLTQSWLDSASLPLLEIIVSPTTSMSNQGDGGIAAAGSGRPASRARNCAVITTPPPAVSPTMAMCSGLIPSLSSER